VRCGRRRLRRRGPRRSSGLRRSGGLRRSRRELGQERVRLGAQRLGGERIAGERREELPRLVAAPRAQVDAPQHEAHLRRRRRIAAERLLELRRRDRHQARDVVAAARLLGAHAIEVERPQVHAPGRVAGPRAHDTPEAQLGVVEVAGARGGRALREERGHLLWLEERRVLDVLPGGAAPAVDRQRIGAPHGRVAVAAEGGEDDRLERAAVDGAGVPRAARLALSALGHLGGEASGELEGAKRDGLQRRLPKRADDTIRGAARDTRARAAACRAGTEPTPRAGVPRQR
jgi:hypothetical protein